VQGYIRYLRSQIADDDPASNYNTEKARLTRAKREDAELALQHKRGELHRAADVEFIMTNMLIAFRAKLETLPHKAVAKVVGELADKGRTDFVIAVLKESVDDALDELSGYDPALFDEGSFLAGLDGDDGEAKD